MSLMFPLGSGTSPLTEVKTDLEQASLGTGGNPVPPDTPQSDPTAEEPLLQRDLLANFPIVANPAMDRVAFDVDQFPNTARGLQGFMEGHRVRVIYYNQLASSGSVRTDIADSPNERAAANTAFRRIDNFEIVLKDALSFNYDKTKAQGEATGTALIYAGMTPRYGDIFLMNAGDNKLGMFKITSIEPQSWYNNRVYLIGYYFFNYPDDGWLKFLEAATVRRSVFTRASFLDGSYALLSEDRYLERQTLNAMRDSLCKYYFRTFFNRELNSFINPTTNVYDPYLVSYMASACEYDVVKARPRQLLDNVQNSYENSIWARLTDPANPLVSDLWKDSVAPIKRNYSMDIGVTELLGYSYIALVAPNSQAVLDGESSVYVLSDAFYRNDRVNMTELECMIYDAILTKSVGNVGFFIAQFLSLYTSLSIEEQFYDIPLYIALIDIALPGLERRVPD